MATVAVRAFELTSTDVATVQKILAAMQPGDRVSWASIGAAIGVRVGDQRIFNVTHRARYKLMRDEQMVFDVVRGEGLIRLSDEQTVNTRDHFIAKQWRLTKRAKRQITSVNYDALPRESKVKHNVALSIFGALGAMLRPRTAARLEKRVEESQKKLDLTKTLEAMMGKSLTGQDTP